VDQDFGQTAVRGARENAAATGLKTVYDQRYPPNLTDFSAMIQSIRAAKPDVVFISCYPYHSIYIVRAVREMGVGPSVKVLGGAIIGLQYGTTLESLGSALNGFVNVHVYVPEKTMAFPGLEDFLTRYAKQAREGGVDPLGFWLAPSNYAIGQMLEQAITATKSFDDRVLANYMHTHVMKTVAGPMQFDKDGEWVTPRALLIQFRGVVDHNLEQFRHPGKQVIIGPDKFKTGDLIWPFEKAAGK
jgi:branched-chain amino acid transport system substrate-binding protein